MKDTITEQILSGHLVKGELKEEHEIGLTIDQTLTQDATGTMVYLEFESLGIDTVKPAVVVSYVDHNIIQTDSRNADDHRFLQSCAAKYGLFFLRPATGYAITSTVSDSACPDRLYWAPTATRQPAAA